MPADTFTGTLGAILMGTGNDNNSWGDNLNNSAIQIFEDAIAKALLTTAVAGQLGASNTLDLSTTPPPAGPSAARWASLIFAGGITANQTIKVPNLTKWWMVNNQCSGAFTVTFKTPSGSPSTAIPANSGWQRVYCDGNNGITVSPFNFDQVQMPDGTVNAPSYSHLLENNSGWYRSGTQDWRLSVNGADVFQVAGPGSAAFPGVTAVNIGGSGGLYFGGVKFDPTAIVPSGVETFYAGIVAPSGWQFCNGQAVSRATFANLFAAITALTTGTTNGGTTITGIPVDLRGLGLVGAFVEITGASIGTTVTSVSVSSIGVTPAITGSTTAALRLIPYGQGDGSTTFNIPDRRGTFIAGRDDMGGTAASKLTLAQAQGILGTKLNATGGEQGHVLLSPSEIPAHTHTATDSGHTHQFTYSHQSAQSGGSFDAVASPMPVAGTGGTNTVTIITGTANITVGSTGSGGAHNNIPPASISNCIIKT